MNAIRKAALLVAAAATFPLGTASAANDWTYYAANAAGNPTNVACIVKGDWIVEVDIMTLNKGVFPPKHILASASDGILDFRDLHIDGTAITNLNIRQGNLWQDANVVEFYANHVTAFNAPPRRAPSRCTCPSASPMSRSPSSSSFSRNPDVLESAP